MLRDGKDVQQVADGETLISADEIEDAMVHAAEPLGGEDAIRLFDDASKREVKELERIVEPVARSLAQRTAP